MLHTRMTGLTENVANHVIYIMVAKRQFDENAGFSSLSQAFGLVRLYRHPLQ